jgi:hypothetical protein
VRYSRTSKQTPVWVTGQALTALERKTFPLAPVARAAHAGKAAPAAATRSQRAQSEHAAAPRAKRAKPAPMGPAVPRDLLVSRAFLLPAYAAGVLAGVLF